MLFPSYSFLLLFLPATLVAYWLKPHIGVLIIASLIFYAMWNPLNVLLLIASFSFNYFVGWVIPRANRPRQVMALGIAANLCVLALYKYSDGALPLGISFFTFTQIGYLVDCLSGRWKKVQFLDFVFFVTFFPHLIAGPILHVREILPQLPKMAITADALAYGAAYFILGLSKKVLLADPIAPVAVTSVAELLRYALQLYFDFSGYSDMAIGLAAMFGLQFPLNFNSPYKAASIIDFWQRWHMTLTRYLRLLLFNPMALALARRGYAEPWLIIPLIITMALAGIWHGAGWLFLAWGLIHAGYLIVNHLWRWTGWPLPAPIGIGLTHSCVVFALIFFYGDGIPMQLGSEGWLAIALGYAIVWGLPNTQTIMRKLPINAWTGAAAGVLALADLIAIDSDVPHAFLYFQF